MKKIILRNITFFIVLLATSCQPIIKQMYSVNKNLSFKSVAEYLDFFEKTNKIEGDNLLYLDSSSQYRFLNEVVSDKLATFYGTFLNDSIELIKSDFLQENMGCMSRVLNEIKNSSVKYDYVDTKDQSLFVKNYNFKKNVFWYLKDNKKFQFDNSSQKLSVFLIYSTQLGTLFKKDFLTLQKYADENRNQVKLFFISLDKCYNLK